MPIFQSAPLSRGETIGSSWEPPSFTNFNPLPSCEGRPRQSAYAFKLAMISIHSPHARGDAPHALIDGLRVISIHSPHTRGDVLLREPFCARVYFNPLPSCEGRRVARCSTRCCATYFNPLPSCEGRPAMLHLDARLYPFQSTPLMRGETLRLTPVAALICAFQSTPLMRGETTRTSWRERRGRFQSAPLIRGETYRTLYRALGMEVFQSAPLMRGETA